MDNFEKLKQLKQLLDEGIITSEEFEKKKAQLLFSGEKEAVTKDEEPKKVEKIEKAEKPKNQTFGNVSSVVKGKKLDKKVLIIGAVCVIGILILMIGSSVARSKRAEEEKAMIDSYTETLNNEYYIYKEGGGYSVSLFLNKNADCYVITNDFVLPTRNAFLEDNPYGNGYAGHTYWMVEKDSKGYYVNIGLDPYNKFYLPEDPSTAPEQLVDSDGNIFEH